MSHSVQDTLAHLRARAHARRAEGLPKEDIASENMADKIAAIVGSWRFVIIQSALLFSWLLFNILSSERVDPYPFILLNLLLSFQAAYTAPVIMMSQNRQAEIDRKRSIEDYDVNCKAELEIETLHQKIDLLREQEIARLTEAVDRLTRALEEKRA